MSAYEEFVAKCKAVVRRLGGDGSSITELKETTDSSGTTTFTVVMPLRLPKGVRLPGTPATPKPERPDPERASDYFSKGFAAYDLGQYERAIQDFDQAIRLYPRYASAYYLRGLSYYEQISDVTRDQKMTDLARQNSLLPDSGTVSHLHQIVYFGPLLDSCLANGRTVDAAVGTHLDVIFQDGDA